MNNMNGREYFESVAPKWDELQQSFYSDRVRDAAFSTAAVQPGRLAADIGAGTGFLTEGLTAAGLKVIAVDRSEAMLAGLQKKLKIPGRVECRPGESESLPLADEEVDYAFANMYLHHVDSPRKAIQEMARIVRKGGRVVITDMDKHDFTFLREEQSDIWLGFERAEISRLMREVGLKDVGVDGIGEQCCADSVCSGEKAIISIFVASGRK
jgi:ubiquinone/menaquinone biosynthesis C-methylase UbiE